MKDRNARRALCSYTPANDKMSEDHLLHDTKCLQHMMTKKKNKSGFQTGSV